MADDQNPPDLFVESHTMEEADRAYTAATGAFLVAAVWLERQLESTLSASFVADRSRVNEFERVWLEDLMFGAKISRFESVLRERQQLDATAKKTVSRLRALNDVRNHIAHRLPATGLDEEISFIFEKGSKITVLTVAKIEKLTDEATELRQLVYALAQPLRMIN